MAKKTIPTLSNAEAAAFCSQMAMILAAGISSTEGAALMLEEAANADEKLLLQKISDTLQETGSLYEALTACGACPDYMLQMVQIGERTGRLDEVMQSLAAHYEREASIARSVKSAVTYPIVMIVMMVVIILILITKVMPIFAQVYRQLGSEMSGISKTILNIGTAISNSSAVLIVILAIVFLLVFYFARTESGRAHFRSLFSHFKGFRQYMERMASCRFASCMVLALGSGLTPEEGLDYAEGLIEYTPVREKIETCRKQMAESGDFSSALATSGIFSGVYARIAAIGSRTGALDEALRQIADRYQEEIDTRLLGIIAALEPALVIILSLVVGLILLSVMLPLMGIMATL